MLNLFIKLCTAPQLSVLKHEKEMMVNSEKRACDEVCNLSERVHRLQVPFLSLEHVVGYSLIWDGMLTSFSFGCCTLVSRPVWTLSRVQRKFVRYPPFLFYILAVVIAQLQKLTITSFCNRRRPEGQKGEN